MNINSDKRSALLVISAALVLGIIARQIVVSSYEYKTFGSIEGYGLIIGTLGFVLQTYGFIKLSEAKGRSGLLGLVMSFFSLLGLILLLALKDNKAPKKR